MKDIDVDPSRLDLLAALPERSKDTAPPSEKPPSEEPAGDVADASLHYGGPRADVAYGSGPVTDGLQSVEPSGDITFGGTPGDVIGFGAGVAGGDAGGVPAVVQPEPEPVLLAEPSEAYEVTLTPPPETPAEDVVPWVEYPEPDTDDTDDDTDDGG